MQPITYLAILYLFIACKSDNHQNIQEYYENYFANKLTGAHQANNGENKNSFKSIENKGISFTTKDDSIWILPPPYPQEKINLYLFKKNNSGITVQEIDYTPSQHKPFHINIDDLKHDAKNNYQITISCWLSEESTLHHETLNFVLEENSLKKIQPITSNAFTIIKNKPSDCYALPQDSLEIYSLLNSIDFYENKHAINTTNYHITWDKNPQTHHHHIQLETNAPPSKRIYLKDKITLREVLCYDKGAEFISDTIYDVNNDKIEDILLTKRMGSNNHVTVYLQKENGLFSDKYTFFNPTFNPQNNLITGYISHQYMDSLKYQFLWNKNLTLDTLTFQ